MSKAEMIAKLKDPKQAQPFGVYRHHFPELFRCLQKAGYQNCLVLTSAGTWEGHGFSNLLVSSTYILTDSYKPEPEFEKRPVEVDDDGECRVAIPGIIGRMDIGRIEAYTQFADWEDEAGGLRDLGGVRKLKRAGKEAYGTFYKEEGE